jgi:hypothetical protein
MGPVHIRGYPRRVCTQAPQAIWKTQTDCSQCGFGTTLGPHFMRGDLCATTIDPRICERLKRLRSTGCRC